LIDAPSRELAVDRRQPRLIAALVELRSLFALFRPLLNCAVSAISET
jgi:hypothetical protein